MSYSDKLKDERWIKLRNEAVEFYSGCNCFGCGNSDNIQVHHKKYKANTEPWDYEVTDLALLCGSCHENYHINSDLLKEILTNNRLFYHYEFRLIIEAVRLICDTDTNYYIDIIENIKSYKKD